MQSLPPPMKVWECNIFTHACLFTGRVPHMSIIHDAMDLTVQPPDIRHGTPTPDIRHGTPQTSDMGPHSQTSDMRPPKPQPWPTLLVTSGWHHCRPVHLRTHRTSNDIWRPKYVWLASGRYPSC